MSGDLFETVDRGALFSPCERFRYRLWRVWDITKAVLVFVMLNPSTADKDRNDQTVERCERRARALGFGGVAVYNAFAYRSTDPAELPKVSDPIGRDNDDHLSTIRATYPGCTIVVGWGNHAELGLRAYAVLALLGEPIQCLGVNANNSPKHPLYVPYRQPLVPYQWLTRV